MVTESPTTLQRASSRCARDNVHVKPPEILISTLVLAVCASVCILFNFAQRMCVLRYQCHLCEQLQCHAMSRTRTSQSSSPWPGWTVSRT